MTRAPIATAFFLCLFCTTAWGEAYRPRQYSSSPRQYYSSWNKHPNRTYYYRTLYFKPSPTYSGYKHHYCIYYKARPQHVYFFNPYKKKFWGRCHINHGGQYSILAAVDRRADVNEIPEGAFTDPGDPPPLPEAEDGILLDLPPDDLPIN